MMNYGVKICMQLKNLFDGANVRNAFFIEGGGTRGVYAIGILKYLFETNPYFKLDSVDIFGGTSVGSFLATALSLGYQRDDITELVKLINIGDLVDSKYMFIKTAYRFLSKGHLYNDAGRQEIVSKILNYKIDIIKTHLGLTDLVGTDITFGHLKTLIQNHPHIYNHLLINAVDISRSKQIFMTSLDDKFDHIKIFDAILASSAIPFVFKPVTLHYDSCADRYNYDGIGTSDCLIDGGVSTGNPLDYFLLNTNQYINYNLWLLKFTSEPAYTEIDSVKTLLQQTMEYLVSGKNDIKMDLVSDKFCINTINLHSQAGTLDIYTQEEMQIIIDDIYNQCVAGKLHFDYFH